MSSEFRVDLTVKRFTKAYDAKGNFFFFERAQESCVISLIEEGSYKELEPKNKKS